MPWSRTVEVVCIHCGTAVRKSLAWFETHDRFICPTCGGVTPADDGVVREVIGRLRRMFGYLGK